MENNFKPQFPLCTDPDVNDPNCLSQVLTSLTCIRMFPFFSFPICPYNFPMHFYMLTEYAISTPKLCMWVLIQSEPWAIPFTFSLPLEVSSCWSSCCVSCFTAAALNSFFLYPHTYFFTIIFTILFHIIWCEAYIVLLSHVKYVISTLTIQWDLIEKVKNFKSFFFRLIKEKKVESLQIITYLGRMFDENSDGLKHRKYEKTDKV